MFVLSQRCECSHNARSPTWDEFEIEAIQTYLLVADHPYGKSGCIMVAVMVFTVLRGTQQRLQMCKRRSTMERIISKEAGQKIKKISEMF